MRYSQQPLFNLRRAVEELGQAVRVSGALTRAAKERRERGGHGNPLLPG